MRKQIGGALKLRPLTPPYVRIQRVLVQRKFKYHFLSIQIPATRSVSQFQKRKRSVIICILISLSLYN